MKLLFSIFVMIVVSATSSPAQSADTAYRDSVYPFSVTFPPSWKKSVSSRPEIRVEVISDYGKGLANFAVAVTPVKGGEKATATQFVRLFLEGRPEVIEAITNATYRNAKVLSKGRTFLANQDAFYIIFEGEYKALDETFEMKSYLIETLFEGSVYAITFTTSKEDFERSLPVFKEIATSFGLIPSKIRIPRTP